MLKEEKSYRDHAMGPADQVKKKKKKMEKDRGSINETVH